MTRLVDVDGENLDRGFVNLRAAESRHEQQLHELINVRRRPDDRPLRGATLRMIAQSAEIEE